MQEIKSVIDLGWRNLLKMAYVTAQESKNPSTQNGAILVNQVGEILIAASNTLTPDGVMETPERNVKPLRYKFSVHAERNIIYKAACAGIKTKDLIMVCGWAACGDCAQGIIHAGIKKLVTHKQALEKNDSWDDEVQLGFTMLREAGVEIIVYDGKIGDVKILRDEAYWEP